MFRSQVCVLNRQSYFASKCIEHTSKPLFFRKHMYVILLQQIDRLAFYCSTCTAHAAILFQPHDIFCAPGSRGILRSCIRTMDAIRKKMQSLKVNLFHAFWKLLHAVACLAIGLSERKKIGLLQIWLNYSIFQTQVFLGLVSVHSFFNCWMWTKMIVCYFKHTKVYTKVILRLNRNWDETRTFKNIDHPDPV